MLQLSLQLRTIVPTILYISTLILTTSLSGLATANIVLPSNAGSYSSAFVDGQALYISGSTTTSSAWTTPSLSAQTFMIDLSISWGTASPVIDTLPDAPSISFMPTTFSPDGKNWIALTNNAEYVLDSKSTSWTRALQIENLNGAGGLTAVTDPETGIIYVPNGYVEATGATSLLMLDLNTNTVGRSEMYPSSSPTTFYSASWSASQHSMIFFGGNTNAMFTFNSSDGWKSLSTSGVVPMPRTSACLVSAYGGSKIVLFGGFSATGNTTLGDIYILDTDTMIWERGPDATPDNGRGGAVCAVSNNQFVAWGGSSFSTIVNATLIYDLASAAWISEYTAPSSSQSSSGTTRLFIILGAVGGVFVVVLAALGALFYRSRTKRTPIVEEESAEKPDYPSSLTLISVDSSIDSLGPTKEIYEDNVQVITTSDSGPTPVAFLSRTYPQDALTYPQDTATFTDETPTYVYETPTYVYEAPTIHANEIIAFPEGITIQTSPVLASSPTLPTTTVTIEEEIFNCPSPLMRAASRNSYFERRKTIGQVSKNRLQELQSAVESSEEYAREYTQKRPRQKYRTLSIRYGAQLFEHPKSPVPEPRMLYL